MIVDFITVVSGLPRSGTSLMMQMLAAGGIPPLTDSLRAPDESNPRGYLEYEPVRNLRSDRNWLALAQGHAVKIIHLLLRELPSDGRFRYRVILVQRPLEEVLASQQAMLTRQGKPGGNPSILAPVYQSQLAQVKEWLDRQPDFSWLAIDYHRLVQKTAAACREIDQFLGGTLDLPAMEKAVDSSLWRERRL